MSGRKIIFAVLFALCAGLATSAFAQTGTSRVTGIVQDANGAVVAGATVVLTNEGTNISFTSTTTTAGVYVFDSIQLGNYTVTVEKQGFKKFVSKGNALSGGQPLTIMESFGS